MLAKSWTAKSLAGIYLTTIEYQGGCENRRLGQAEGRATESWPLGAQHRGRCKSKSNRRLAQRVSERERASQMALKDTDGKNGFIGNLSSGEIGVCILTDYLGGMDDPKKRKWRRKIETPQPRLQEVCFSPTHSPGDCIQDPPYPCPVIRCQKVFGSSATIDSRYNISCQKNFRNLLEA